MVDELWWMSCGGQSVCGRKKTENKSYEDARIYRRARRRQKTRQENVISNSATLQSDADVAETAR